MIDPATPLSPEAEIDPKADGVLVFTMPWHLTAEDMLRWNEELHRVFPGRTCLVLPGGAQVQDLAAQSRIEHKIDRVQQTLDGLMQVLADEDETPDEDTPGLTLDGDSAGSERDQNTPL